MSGDVYNETFCPLVASIVVAGSTLTVRADKSQRRVLLCRGAGDELPLTLADAERLWEALDRAARVIRSR